MEKTKFRLESCLKRFKTRFNRSVELLKSAMGVVSFDGDHLLQRSDDVIIKLTGKQFGDVLVKRDPTKYRRV